MRPENRIIVDWIARELAMRDWIQKDLVDRLPGWGQSTVSKVMRGGRKVTAPEIMLLLELFGYGNPLNTDGSATLRQLITLVGNLSPEQRAAFDAYLQAAPKPAVKPATKPDK